jgi:hypothetical protein
MFNFRTRITSSGTTNIPYIAKRIQSKLAWIHLPIGLLHYIRCHSGKCFATEHFKNIDFRRSGRDAE